MLYPRMKAVIEKETGVLVAGYVPELDFWQVGSRHLGLVLPGEIENLQEQMRQLGDCLERHWMWMYYLSWEKKAI